MPNPEAPPGWYPDPSDARIVRYWDGTTWSDLTATPEQPLPPSASTTSTEPRPEESMPVVRESNAKTWVTIGVALLVAVVVIGVAASLTNRPSDSPPPFGYQPDQEKAVVELIEKARQEYDAANHDLQRDAALTKRDEEICRILDADDGRVEGWTGKIHEIESNHAGEGILGINIEPNTQVTVRNNAFAEEDTLIQPGPLLEQVTELEIGQVVTFSGQFIADEDGPCFTNPRFTQAQRIAKPLMVFRFDDVHG